MQEGEKYDYLCQRAAAAMVSSLQLCYAAFLFGVQHLRQFFLHPLRVLGFAHPHPASIPGCLQSQVDPPHWIRLSA